MFPASFRSALKTGSQLSAAIAVLSLSLCTVARAQEIETEIARATSRSLKPVIPQQVRFGGMLLDRSGDSVEAVFRIYSGAEGGEALWSETQKIAVAQDGTYSVLLGAASVKGLPQTVFGSGQARWVGVTVERGEEQARIPLASAAYAMKAGDAQTLGGLPARSFVTQAQLAATAQALAEQASAQITPAVAPTGSGSTDYVPLWTSASVLGNSMLYQTGSKVGLGTTTPLAPLHVIGPGGGTGAVSLIVQGGGGSGTLRMGADVNTNTLTASTRKLARITMPDWAADSLGITLFSGDVTGANANDLYFGGTPGGSQYAATGLHFVTAANGTTTGGTSQMTLTSAGNLGIGTASPATKLEVSGTAKFDGLITFASGQTFPGAGGTITGITTTSPLTGSGTTGSVALGLNTASLETTLNSFYSQLGASTNTFAGGATFAKSITASTSGSGNTAITGIGSTGAAGISGTSDTGYGGFFTNSSAPMPTVYAINSGNVDSNYYPVALDGHSTGTDSVGVYGIGTLVGVWGATTVSGAYGVYGAAGDGYAASFESAGADYPTVYAQNTAAGTDKLSPVAFQASATGNTAYGVYSVVTGPGGNGLYGESDGTVSGSGITSVGVTGLATGKDSDGLVGKATGAGGYGLYAHASGAMDSTRYASAGVYALADSGTGVEGFAAGQSAVYNQYQAGYSPSATAGVWGDTPVVAGDSYVLGGVTGTADNNVAGFFANNSSSSTTVEAYNHTTGGPSGLFQVFKGSTPEGTCGIGGAGNLTCTGQVKTLATTAGGAHTVETYSMQSPENWMEDFGTGTLERGAGKVRIDAAFADTVSNDASYHVFLTPRGDSKGLYVINATPTGFEVRESGGGTSSLSFDYRIVAKRRGYEAQRLTDVTERFSAEQASLRRRNLSGTSQAASRGIVESASGRRAARPAGRVINRNIRPGGDTPRSAPAEHISPASIHKSAANPAQAK